MFSGAGGLDLGFLLNGHKIVWANDFDKNAIETYNYNLNKELKHEVVLGDITKILDEKNVNINKLIPDADILIGGFPCQGFSIANIKRNVKDSRNFLYLEILKVLKIKSPKFFILENVKGLENMEKGKILEMILKDLEGIGKYGYEVNYNILNACDFGVAQNRERVIILGVRKDGFDNYNFPIVKRENKKVVKDYKNLNIKPLYSINSDVCPPYSCVQISNILFDGLQRKKLVKIEELLDLSKIYRQQKLKDVISELPLEFTPNSDIYLNHDGSKCKVNINGRVGNRATYWDKISPTIMGRGSGTGGPLIIPHPNLHRRMSVREVARIQSFPDKFYFKGSNSSKYRQIGNAVPPIMAYYIARIFNGI